MAQMLTILGRLIGQFYLIFFMTSLVGLLRTGTAIPSVYRRQREKVADVNADIRMELGSSLGKRQTIPEF